MRTFKLSINMQAKISMPDQFIQAIRASALEPEASEFIKQAVSRHPVDDEALAIMVLRNGTRRTMRNALLDALVQGGMGGTVTPATVEAISSPPDHEGPVPTPQVIEVQRQESLETSEDEAKPYTLPPYSPPKATA